MKRSADEVEVSEEHGTLATPNPHKKQVVPMVSVDQFINADKKKLEFRNYVDSPRQETVNTLYRLQHENQTVEFVRGMHERHLKFDKVQMTVWDMLQFLNRVVDDSDPDTNLTQIDHAIQTAESIRREFPGEENDWFHLTGFIHDLGKIMNVTDKERNLVGDPQWSVVGDTLPVGCKPCETGIVFPEHFSLNPDMKNAKYSTKIGMYEEGCGLDNVLMSWGHDEYLYHFAKKYSTLPLPALYMIRYHSFYPWHKHNQYTFLTNDQDKEMLEWVKKFNRHDLYSKSHELPDYDSIIGYYKQKMEKYFGKEPLWW